MFKKVYLYVFIALCFSLLCTGIAARYYKDKYDQLMEQHRVELELAGERAAVLTDTLERAREETRAIGESLGKQRTSVAELRELIREVKTRYEKMEDLLNSVGNYDSNIRLNDSSNDYTSEVQ